MKMYLIALVNSRGVIKGFHRGETGKCADPRDAKIYQSSDAAHDAVRALKSFGRYNGDNLSPVTIERVPHSGAENDSGDISTNFALVEGGVR